MDVISTCQRVLFVQDVYSHANKSLWFCTKFSAEILRIDQVIISK